MSGEQKADRGRNRPSLYPQWFVSTEIFQNVFYGSRCCRCCRCFEVGVVVIGNSDGVDES